MWGGGSRDEEEAVGSLYGAPGLLKPDGCWGDRGRGADGERVAAGARQGEGRREITGERCQKEVVIV